MGTHTKEQPEPTVHGQGAHLDIPSMQAVFDTMPAGVVVQSTEGQIMAVNPAAERILGLTLSQMRGLTSIDPSWHALQEDGSDFPGSAHPAMQALRTGLPVDDVVMGVFNPHVGRHSWLHVSSTPIRNAAGELLGVYSFFEDITERKRLEVRAQEYRIALQTSSDGFWVTDGQGRLLEANPAYAQASGYSQSELLALHIDQLDALEQASDVQERMERIQQSGHERFVTTHRRRDGRHWPVEMVVTYAPMQGGRYFCFIRDLTEQQRSAELIWHQANFDRLTELPNRALFFDRLSREFSLARRSGKLVALLYADLDAFKPINDQYGHAAGDLALQTVAARWQSCVRSTDTIARLGGDEFAIIAGHLDSTQEAAAIAEKLIQALQEDIALPGGRQARLGVSIGISLYPTNAAEMDCLLSLADDTMFACKASGKNTYAFSSAHAHQTPDASHWIHFQESHLVGVAEIDAQHRQLVRLVNEINLDLSAHAIDAHIAKRFDELMQFTRHHFLTEHRFMQAYRYPHASAHDYEHSQLINDLQLIAERKGRDGDLLVLQKIKDWLMGHIQHADRALGIYLQGKGVH